MAQSCSARPGGMASDSVTGSPSDEATTACVTSATRSVKSVTSQSRLCFTSLTFGITAPFLL